MLDQIEGAMFIRYSYDIMSFDMLVAHGPTECTADERRTYRRRKMRQMVMRRSQTNIYPLIVLADINAAVGSRSSLGIGQHGLTEENKHGADLRRFIGEAA